MSEPVAAVSRRGVLGGVAGVLGVGLVGGLAGCAPSKPETTPSDDTVKAAVTVRAIDNSYDPPEVQIVPGQAVRWVFEGTNEHDVVADDGSFVSELMREGSFTHLFEVEGEFEYDCSIHPEMRGVVRVTAIS